MHVLGLPVVDVAAQTGQVSWQLYVDGARTDVTLNAPMPLDSLPAVAQRIVDEQRSAGYYLAQLDSVLVSDTTLKPVHVRLFVGAGPQVRVGRFELAGVETFSEAEIEDLIASRRGRVLDRAVLLADIERILRFYESNGYAFARAYVDTIRLDLAGEEPELVVTLRIDEGNRVRVNDIVLTGARRTKVGYVELATGLRKGEWLNRDMEEVHRILQASTLFRAVDPPRLIRIGDEDVVIQIPVIENDPGSFDLVLGYQPPSSGGSSSGLVGNGHLALRNMFGRGRRIGLKLNRLPGQVSHVEADFADPFVFRLPLSIEAGFIGLQQDSTYGQQSYRGAVGYTLAGGLETLLTISREVTKPGQAGLQLREGRQRVPQSEILFAGITVRFSRLDRPVNPRRGVVLETRLERGRKRRTSFELAGGGADTTRVLTVSRQERLTAIARAFVPTFNQQVLAFGNESRVLISERFDASDLFRLGGAQSLRGYDEDRFRGRFVSRAFVEYRYLFEQRSYAFVFFDLGYVDRPATPEGEAQKNFYPGYGLGVQFETGVGLINTSLGLASGDNPSQAKVHVGLSVGL